MKLVAAWILAAVVAALAAGSCTVRHKSSDYECATTADCSDGRGCVEGYCIPFEPLTDARTDGSSPGGDARDASPPDTSTCPAECTSCGDGMKCVIDCAIDSCNSEVVCPPGWNCVIGCSTTNSCSQGIDCADAASCTITCSGQNSCRDVECGEGACKVACSGRGSCVDVDCGDSCACDVTCQSGTSGASCTNTTCQAIQCGQFGGRCSSLPAGCNTCQ